MNSHSFVSLIRALIPLSMIMVAAAWQPAALAETRHVIVESGDSALSKEAARQSGEQWNSTRSLRSKVNARTEKEFDKVEKAIDGQEKCNASYNVNAYWEANTERCLDRRTGRPVTP
ncbi:MULTISPECIES: DUF1283 family protein [unclassified Brenneria]|uniref:DUF1283 family protein n=1 Tax=unclassified Brenneria TaxID=2634434 RepID=UPI0015522983|nr:MULTISPECIES: DUF1283 family protein [unclassified Brenneria]MBJ7220798.1 DUF1283 family protein [Brenneria sp. L3-3C-1]MEE3642038.1 DUF1283 family protein [Brenneria sp. L3_3C_1]MEE3649265.1 DUF1283 family protein [Brenneria sp. HEZEL_4_2_4]NPC99218.1 DUF1283 family protein [Brenneria sp. hezel4-2-4]